MLYERFVLPFLMKKDPEDAHDLVIKTLDVLGGSSATCAAVRNFLTPSNYRLKQRIFNVEFPNPIGLAAGFAKKPVGLHGLAALGFGFIELGTITPSPQQGNEKPRIFRLPEDHALINRMGFPNPGADDVASVLQHMPKLPIPLGINIGKGKDTPLEEAARDYVECFQKLAPFGDYMVVNVSSPNTLGLRKLQSKEHLDSIFRAIKRVQDAEPLSEYEDCKFQLPVLVKLAPDLDGSELDDVLEVCTDYEIDGVIAGNTTLNRQGLLSNVDEKGGLSGLPLHNRACGLVRSIRGKKPHLPIIGVGGISSPDDVTRMRDAGADLFQVYTGLVYKGPFLPRTLLQALAA